jgi:hypothetical protein
MALDFATLETLQKSHPAWRLLMADNAPLVASFLYRVFVAPNARGVSRAGLVSLLEDSLYELRLERGAEAYPRDAAAYLDGWAQESQGWLRKYYPPGADEPHYDLTPATEKALAWLEGLTQRSFVGTESRLLTVFELLRQLVHGSGADPEARLQDLERRRASLDREIEAVRAGQAPVFDEPAVRDRFQQVAATSRELLSDFREVEQNFRRLDRETREKIALWAGGKGELLGKILGERDAIADSDQGRSFQAFWDFLMDPSRQEELGSLWEKVFSLPSVRSLNPDPRLRRIHFDWLEAGDHTQKTVALLSRQLRRFLDDQAWLESRRIMEILHHIETEALAIRDDLPYGTLMEIDTFVPDIELPLERPLYSPPLKSDHRVEVIAGDGRDVVTDVLYDQVFIDRSRLEKVLEETLATRPQVTLARLIGEHPLERGLAELVVWLSVVSDRPGTVFDEATPDPIAWVDAQGRSRVARLSRIILSKNGEFHGRR